MPAIAAGNAAAVAEEPAIRLPWAEDPAMQLPWAEEPANAVAVVKDPAMWLPWPRIRQCGCRGQGPGNAAAVGRGTGNAVAVGRGTGNAVAVAEEPAMRLPWLFSGSCATNLGGCSRVVAP